MKPTISLNYLKWTVLQIMFTNFESTFACTPPEQFEKYQIVPDVLDKAPLYKLEVNIEVFQCRSLSVNERYKTFL